jgi:hypothetical protein
MFKVTIAETRDTGMEESAVIEVKALPSSEPLFARRMTFASRT